MNSIMNITPDLDMDQDVIEKFGSKNQRLQRGKDLFNQLEQYPLQKKQGVKDYVFYLVPRAENYGKSARIFMKKFYPNHIKKEASSLEGLITYLVGHVKTGKTKHIREIVIVSHGNANALLFPVVEQAKSNQKNEDAVRLFRYLTTGSLKNLQHAFQDSSHGFHGELQLFRTNRKKVVEKITQKSWITIRACNFGKNLDGLFALASFFGGRAEVYAPSMYQVFAKIPIHKDFKFNNREAVYRHLFLQGFFRNTKHSPKRKEKVLEEIITAPKYGPAFSIARSEGEMNSLGNGSDFVAVRNELNAKRLSKNVRNQFQAKGFTLSSKARIRVRDKDDNWLVKDTLRSSNGRKFKVEYVLKAEEESGFKTYSKINVYGHLVSHPKAAAKIPFQLFWDENGNDNYNGFLAEVISYRLNDNEDKENQKKFAGIVQQLNDGLLQGAIDLIQFMEAVPMAFNNTAVSIKPLKQVEDERIWVLTDGNNKSFRFVEKISLDQEGRKVRVLNLFEDLSIAAQTERLNYIGTDSASPGTELMAFLNRLSIGDLVCWIEYLRKEYRPENAFYIEQAQRALQNKPDFNSWYFMTQYWKKQKDWPFFQDPFHFLTEIEIEDKRKYAYEEPDYLWIKSAFPLYEGDPFEAQMLEFPGHMFTKPITPDSPGYDVDDVELPDDQEFEYFLPEQAEKEIYEEEEPVEISCEQFKQLLSEIKRRQLEEPDKAIKIIVEDIGAIGETNDVASFLYKAYNVLSLTVGLMENFESYAGLGGASGRIGNFVARRGFWRLSFSMGILSGVDVLLGFFNTVGEAVERAKSLGELEGITTAAHLVKYMVVKPYIEHGTQVPAKLSIATLSPEYINIYKSNMNSSPFTFNQDHRVRGFKKGIAKAEQIFNEGLDRTKEVLSDSLYIARLSRCKIDVLFESGLINLNAVRAEILKAISSQLDKKAQKLIDEW